MYEIGERDESRMNTIRMILTSLPIKKVLDENDYGLIMLTEKMAKINLKQVDKLISEIENESLKKDILLLRGNYNFENQHL